MCLHRLPQHVPPLSVLVRDLGSPHPGELARALGSGERTARRWLCDDCAPRPVLLSLFWLTSWGRQWLDADQHTRLVQQMHLSSALARELDRARLDQDAKKAPEFPPAPALLYLVK